ncbi:MAG TPA: thioesterase family protein [Solirubrobacteraceae bacterium]|nr:thioesterase family protein [Solirubrobacteraceae bacterium]
MTPPISPGQLLATETPGQLEALGELAGFGGFHGGLALALITRAMQQRVADMTLRSATARFHRPLEGAFEIEVTTLREGRTTSMLAARALGEDGVGLDGTGVFGAEKLLDAPVFEPLAPAAAPHSECERFALPVEFVPITAYLEIRPVGPNRPYAGGDDPELTAWIRMTEDEQPPDQLRFLFMMDALAPSYAAVLNTPIFVPTVELTVLPGPKLSEAESPWILLHARTSACARGWAQEQIDAWGVDGSYLGSAQQLRVLRAVQGTP